MVGRNGAGKTTTMRIMAGEMLPAAGGVQRSGRIGYLPQDPRESDLSVTVRSRILSVRGIDGIIARLRRYEDLMAKASGPDLEAAMASYARAESELVAAGGYSAASDAAKIAANLALPERVLDQPLHELSGGQRRRVELARILYSQADTLLLDEPTNHLDADSVVWLRDFLKTYAGGVMMISHDTMLIENVVTKVFHLDANRAVLDTY